jgi:hypothetical protein
MRRRSNADENQRGDYSIRRFQVDRRALRQCFLHERHRQARSGIERKSGTSTERRPASTLRERTASAASSAVMPAKAGIRYAAALMIKSPNALAYRIPAGACGGARRRGPAAGRRPNGL